MHNSPIQFNREWDKIEVFFRERLQTTTEFPYYLKQDREYNNSNFSVNMFD